MDTDGNVFLRTRSVVVFTPAPLQWRFFESRVRPNSFSEIAMSSGRRAVEAGLADKTETRFPLRCSFGIRQLA